MVDARTRRILITRPQPVADEFADKLKREGFEVYLAPMTEYVEINAGIGDLANYQGLIFTSTQGVNIFARRFTERYIAVFAVGDATAQAAQAAGFRRVYSAQGDGQALVSLLRSQKSLLDLKRLLHVCGEDTAEDFVEALKGDGLYVDRAVVYKAKYLDHLPEAAVKALQEGDITTVTLFSARAAANFTKLLQQDAELKGVSSDIEAVCLSDRVAAEIKGVPWRIVRVASNPQLESVLDILRQKEEGRYGFEAMQADPVIEAFGGLRPLATKLDITPSTVQGWKKRGVIPESRVEAVLMAARSANINPDLLWKEKKGNDAMTDSSDGSGKASTDKGGTDKGGDAGKTASGAGGKAGGVPPPTGERRRGQDRRMRYATPDYNGVIRSDAYTGPDRRTKADRRDYQTRQQQRIRSEKWYFVNRSMIMGSVFFMCVMYGASFLLKPEFDEWRAKGEEVKAMQAQMEEMNARILDLQKRHPEEAQQQAPAPAPEPEPGIGQSISNHLGQVEDVENTISTTASNVSSAASSATSAAGAAIGKTETGQDIMSLLQVLSNLNAMNRTEGGKDAVGKTLDNLMRVLAGAPTDTDSLNSAIATAKRSDKTLTKLLGSIGTKDLGAAGLLLALNEFRNNVNTQHSFEQDLLIMEKYAGDDPELQKSLKRLAPYARSGVLNRQQLQDQFKGLASDIVMAKLQGQDLSVKEEMLKRLSKLVKVRKIDDIEGNSVDAVVARAQLKLNNNDVRGAMAELQSLNGAPAQAAAPFMDAAAGNVMADDASTQLTQMIMQRLQTADTSSMQGLMDSVTQMLPGGDGDGAVPIVSPGLLASPPQDSGQ